MLTLSILAALAAADDFNAVKLAESVRNSIVRIEVAGTDKIGTGFIVHPAGYILTNHHVISPLQVGETDRLQVEFFPHTENPDEAFRLAAEVYAIDEMSDLALLRPVNARPDSIKGEGVLTRARTFHALPFAESVDVGESVLAIGFSLGLRGAATVTRGIISADDRNTLGGTSSGLIQTDAFINPGNSGGPLLNAKGEVVGVNTLSLTSKLEFKRGIQAEVFSGISYARAYETARFLSEQLRKNRRVNRIEFGLDSSSNFYELKRVGSPFPWSGVLIEKLKADSPLRGDNGLVENDVIYAIIPEGDDRQRKLYYIANRGDLDNVLAMTYGAASITVYYYRFDVKVLERLKQHSEMTPAEIETIARAAASGHDPFNVKLTPGPGRSGSQ